MDPYRLPRTVVPSHYDLRLTPALDAGTFTGTVAIEVDVADEIDEVVLNAAELTIGEAWIENPEGIRRNATVALDDEAERATLALEEPAAAGPWTVHLAFAGILNDKLHGFYRSTFVDDEGVERVIATTQFEATSARRAFPCWDEPDFKATFGVTLVVPDDLLAVSNAAEVGRTPTDDGRVAVTFADTMVMSTYLVAFVVGPLEATEAIDAGGTPLRVVHPPGKGHLAGFALEVGAFALAFFEDYYGIPYPGDKVDLVAVPDFAFGAMENLGCITFREVLLLVDPDAVTQPELQRVVDVIAHELAHMWFGDLVTMKWWNGIWLNEAFATFMEMLCTDAFRPEWERWVDFGLSRTAAFDVDSLASTRPIEFEVVSPADSEGMFDVLTYEKGAAVVRMLEQWTGPREFRAGIRSYLEAHRYANTETTDLWDAIEAANPGLPVRKVMDSWIFQGGYPLVTVERTASGVRLRQQRFSFEGGDEVAPTTWSVPVLVRAGTDEVEAAPDDGDAASTTAVSGRRIERTLVEGAPVELELGDVAWVQANANGSGFYRVDYDAELRTALAARAQDVLAPIERYGLVDDTWASVFAGRTTTPEFCEFVGGFSDETDLAVWQRLLGALDALDRLLDGAPRRQFQGFVRDLVGPAAARLGASGAAGESDRDRELRAALFTALGTTGADPAVGERARALLDAHDTDPAAVDPSLAAAAVAVIAATGTAADRDDFLTRYRAATTPQDEQRYLRSLPDFNDPGSFADTLTMTLSEVRSQDAPFVLRRALINRERGAEAWAFLRDHWDDVGERLPSNSIARLLEGVRWLSHPEVAADVVAFLDDHPVPQGARTIAQHLERLTVNVALRRREADRLAAVFGG